MGNFKNTYITRDEFYHLVQTRHLYEGYVIGLGYAYCETYEIIPSHLNGYSPEWTDRPAAYTHSIIATDQCIDINPNIVLKSLRITPECIYNSIVSQSNQGVSVNMGNGREFFIPSGTDHTIDINISEYNDILELRVRVENLETHESSQTECQLIDFPVVYGVFPDIPEANNNKNNNEEGVGQPGFWESLIPIWGSGRSAVDHFQKGNIWRGVLYTALAVSDVFLVKSIATSLAKGAFKVVGSHSWGATRKWMLRHGYAGKNEPLHHWAISQSTAKKHGIESIANQPWNLKRFPSELEHFRYGHGWNIGEVKGANKLQQLWFGTPNWPKYIIGSYGMRPVIGTFDDEFDNE